MTEPKNKNRKLVHESTIHAYSGKGRTQEELIAAEEALDADIAKASKIIPGESNLDRATRRLKELKEENKDFKHGGLIKGWPPVGSRKKN